MQRLILPITFKAPARKADGTPYIGEYYPTVNHVYQFNKLGRGKQIKEPAKIYLQEIAWLARNWVTKTGWKMPSKDKKVIIEFWFWFKDGNRPDCGNCEKVIVDALEGIILENDRMALPRMMDFDFDKENPRLELSFEVVE